MIENLLLVVATAVFGYRLWTGWRDLVDVVQFAAGALMIGLITVPGVGQAVLVGLVSSGVFWVSRHTPSRPSQLSDRTELLMAAAAAAGGLLALWTALDGGRASGLVIGIVLAVVLTLTVYSWIKDRIAKKREVDGHQAQNP